MQSARQLMHIASVIVAGMLALQAYGCDDSSRSPTRASPDDGESSLVGPSPTNVTFSGRVIDFVTQAPVASVSVEFRVDSQQPGPSETTTNANGQYALTVPRTGAYFVQVDGAFAGLARVNGRGYRGDLLVSRSTCISRYGLLLDSLTLRSVSGATAALVGRTVMTGADGWYRIDLGCPDVILPGGTTVIRVTHPGYQDRVQVVGRGVSGVARLDIDLERR